MGVQYVLWCHNGKQSFGIYWEVFRDLEIKDDFVTPYKPLEADKLAAKDDKYSSLKKTYSI